MVRQAPAAAPAALRALRPSGGAPALGRRACGVLGLALAGTVALAACAGGSGGAPEGAVAFSDDPLTQVQSQSGAFTLALRTSPQPPERGLVEAQLTITQLDGGTA